MRFNEHAFDPKKDEPEKCNYPGCMLPELMHEWTVNAKRANPEPAEA